MTDRDISLAALATACLTAAEAATPGPWEPNVWIETDGNEWRATGPGHDDESHDHGSEPGCPDEKAAQRDAAFIALARTALPQLARGYLEAVGELDTARTQHMADIEAADQRLLGVLDGSFSVGDGTAQKQIETLTADLAEAHAANDRLRETYKNVSSVHADRASRMDDLRKERDAARADIERLRNDAAVVRDGHWDEVLAERDAAREALREACDLLSNLAHRYERGEDYVERLAALRKKGGL